MSYPGRDLRRNMPLRLSLRPCAKCQCGSVQLGWVQVGTGVGVVGGMGLMGNEGQLSAFWKMEGF